MDCIPLFDAPKKVKLLLFWNMMTPALNVPLILTRQECTWDIIIPVPIPPQLNLLGIFSVLTMTMVFA